MSSRLKTLFALHLLLMVYSTSGILSKLAAGVDFLSWQFVALYAGIIALLGVYAIGWQQILRRMPLTSAFSNKAVTIVWGIVWGALFFSEPITVGKVIGAALIIAGVVLFAHADGEEQNDGEDGASGGASGGGRRDAGSEAHGGRDANADADAVGSHAANSPQSGSDLLGSQGVIIDG